MGRSKSMKYTVRLMALCLVAALLLPLVPAASAASGTCGQDVAWTLETGVLTISGSGMMANYSEQNPAPWSKFADQITAVVVKQGVQSVGALAFFQLEKLQTVTLANSVGTIGQCAFYGCKQLAMLNMSGVEEIGESAFEQCSALQTLRLPESVQTLRSRAFYRCDGLLSVTVPAGVTKMEGSVFAYCHNLRIANIMATLEQLPYWTFYGCYDLEIVRLSKSIIGVGESALNGTKVESPEYTDKVPQISFDHTQSETVDDTTVTVDTYYNESADAAVSTVVTTVNKAGNKDTTVQINATVESAKGWNTIESAINSNRYGVSDVQVDVWLKGNTTIAGTDLARFAGKDITVTLHTAEGVRWHIDGKNLNTNELAQKYDLSYTLVELVDPDEKQAAALAGHKGYLLRFNGVLDFKVTVELPFSVENFRQSAVFFTLEKDGYARRQAVMIDQAGIAQFYLGQVDANVDYLIGINVPQKIEQDNQNPLSDVIIPNSMKDKHQQMEQTEEIQYVITGTKSSLGISFGQLTIILAAVMITCAVVIGVVIRMNFKRKLKAGYVPDMSYADEEDE